MQADNEVASAADSQQAPFAMHEDPYALHHEPIWPNHGYYHGEETDELAHNIPFPVDQPQHAAQLGSSYPQQQYDAVGSEYRQSAGVPTESLYGIHHPSVPEQVPYAADHHHGDSTGVAFEGVPPSVAAALTMQLESMCAQGAVAAATGSHQHGQYQQQLHRVSQAHDHPQYHQRLQETQQQRSAAASVVSTASPSRDAQKQQQQHATPGSSGSTIPLALVQLPRPGSFDLSASFSGLTTTPGAPSGFSPYKSAHCEQIWPPAVSLGSPLTAVYDKSQSVTGFSVSDHQTESDSSPGGGDTPEATQVQSPSSSHAIGGSGEETVRPNTVEEYHLSASAASNGLVHAQQHPSQYQLHQQHHGGAMEVQSTRLMSPEGRIVPTDQHQQHAYQPSHYHMVPTQVPLGYVPVVPTSEAAGAVYGEGLIAPPAAKPMDVSPSVIQRRGSTGSSGSGSSGELTVDSMDVVTIKGSVDEGGGGSCAAAPLTPPPATAFRRSMSMPNITPVHTAALNVSAKVHPSEDKKRIKPFHTKAMQILLARRWTKKEDECRWVQPATSSTKKSGKDPHAGPGITAKILFAQRKFVWEWDISPQGERAKIEVPFSTISGMCRVDSSKIAVTVELTEPAKVVRGVQQPKTSTKWHALTEETDPTGGAAQRAKIHSLYFSSTREKEIFQALNLCKTMEPNLTAAMEKGVDVINSPVEFTLEEIAAMDKSKRGGDHGSRKKRGREASGTPTSESPTVDSKFSSPGSSTAPLVPAAAADIEMTAAGLPYGEEVAMMTEGAVSLSGAAKRRKSIGTAFGPPQASTPSWAIHRLLATKSTCRCAGGCSMRGCPCAQSGKACQACQSCAGGQCANPWTYLYFSGVNLEMAKKDQLFVEWLVDQADNAKHELEGEVTIVCGCGSFPRKLRDCIGGVSCTLFVKCGSVWNFANVLVAKEMQQQLQQQEEVVQQFLQTEPLQQQQQPQPVQPQSAFANALLGWAADVQPDALANSSEIQGFAEQLSYLA